MPTTDLSGIWQSLEVESSRLAKTGYLLRRASPECDVDLFVGIRCPEQSRVLVLRAPLGALPKAKELPEARGLAVFTEVLPDDDRDTGCLVIQLRDSGYGEVFSIFASILVVSACAHNTATSAVTEVMSQLFRWQQFLDSHATGLGDEAQRGLFGELFVLRLLLRATGDLQLVRAWCGPDRSTQDFRFDGGIALEVKTSMTPEPQSIRVNGERQLDSSNLSALYLVSLSVDRLPDSGEKLPELVQSVRNVLRDSPATLDVFDSRLILAGYLGTHEQRYQLYGFVVRSERAFRVLEGFPRLVESDLPEGVGQVNYRVSLSACAKFSVQFAEIVQGLSARAH